MDIQIRTSQLVNGHSVTARQIEVLRAIKDEGSKNAAAKKLGISPPVVHKYMDSLEKGAGIKILKSTPLGTELTDEALRIIEVADMADLRSDLHRKFTVACTPVTEDLMMSVLSHSKLKADLVISNDASNVRALREGIVNCIIVDDPLLLFELEDFKWAEIGYMDMIHVDRGPSYIKYKYGAQRIAYEYLDSLGKDYTVDGETYLLSELLDSGKSFFVDEFLLMRRGIKMMSSTDKHLLRHTINAVYRRDSPCMQRLLKAIYSRRMI